MPSSPDEPDRRDDGDELVGVGAGLERDTAAVAAAGAAGATSAAAAPRHDADLEALEAGLDALETQPVTPRRRVRNALVRVGIIAATLAVLVAIWQLLTGGLPEETAWKAPSPADVWGRLNDIGWANLADIAWTSLHRGLIGFAISILIATPLALGVWAIRPLRITVGPVLTGLQTLPSVAWVPPAILWFGLNDRAIYFVILLGAIPSITNGLLAGLDHIPRLYRRAGQVLGARRATMAFYVLLPAALPGYVSGLRQGWAFAWRSLMAAELIAFSLQLGLGLGQALNQQRLQSSMAGMLAIIFVIFLVGLLVELLIFAPIERAVLARRGLGHTGR